jgi:Sulfocyanin (SoxE) domain
MNGHWQHRTAGFALALACAGAGTLSSQVAVQVDPTWLKADSAASRVDFTLVAGLTPSNGGMNYNGAGTGGLTLTVPVHWTVVLHFRNNDQVLPHSAMVIAAVTPVPVSGAKPAFPHAATRRPDEGVSPGGHEDVQFVAAEAGSYLIYCAVPGHGAAGMWIRLDVSADAHAPALAVTPAKAP